MSGEGDESDEPKGAIRVKGGKNIHIGNVYGSGGTGVHVSGDAENVTISGEVSGFDRGVVNKGCEVHIRNALLSGNLIGYLASQRARGTIEDSTFDNVIADIVYHPDASIDIITTGARRVLELTNGSLKPIQASRHITPVEVELNQKARGVLNAESEDEKRDRFIDLAVSALSSTKGPIAGAVATKVVEITLEELAQSAPDIIDSLTSL